MPRSKGLKIFVVEDDDWYCRMLEYTFKLNPDDEVAIFKSGEAFLKRLNEKPDVVTLDFHLPDMGGDVLLKEIKSLDPDIEVIIISEQSSIETAVELLKEGAFDYIVKQEDIRDRLSEAWGTARRLYDVSARITAPALYSTVSVSYMMVSGNFRVHSTVRSLGGGLPVLQLWG